MSYRHDAVYGFAKICAEAIDRANEIGDPLVLTFGKVIPKLQYSQRGAWRSGIYT